MYTKPVDEKLDCRECLKLLQVLAECGFIATEENSDNILVYREKSGWCSENIQEVAEYLSNDIDGQRFLRRELADRNIVLEFEEEGSC